MCHSLPACLPAHVGKRVGQTASEWERTGSDVSGGMVHGLINGMGMIEPDRACKRCKQVPDAQSRQAYHGCMEHINLVIDVLL